MMFQLNDYIKPDSIDEAYKLLQKSKNNVILGGNTFLKLSDKKYNIGIDLSNLNLNEISKTENEYEIGAYTTYGDICRYEEFHSFASGALVRAIENIVGSQFRNHVTVGASVYSKYGFSDFIPVLLALKAEVLLYNNGRMSLSEFLNSNIKRDILLKVYIPIGDIKCIFKSFRSTKTDFSIVNLALSENNGSYLLAVGARPSLAELCPLTSKFLSENKIDKTVILKAKELLFNEISFGSNAKASKEYRQKLAGNLFKKALLEMEEL
ncbi:FAD-binding protein [Anaerosphaera multitolerans]|uniref:FAD-binding protein n=2 Tax=Anaerosphaera multitolerans TaxID=2487351 RepID=A0A437S545_9FIRM|nr:FAD-binding protein [Anaerosphaera multitolerans]